MSRNAGMFIWMDLRRYLTAGGTAVKLTLHHLTPGEKGDYQQREMEIGSRFFANGVAIALGTNFFTEELGWFRLSFTASRPALETGLQRMLKALQDIERLGW
jgi:bifunctional pyridoxal-dependent enzyme with beta-cystathionase and maltose regulon repressor activities